MSLPVRTGQLSWRSGAQESVTSFDVVGEGRAALLLPALSSIGTREEMRPLASRLGGRFQCLIPDWPGFGNAPRAQVPVTVETMRRFLRAFIDRQTWSRPIAVAAGHAAPYLVEAAREHPSLFERLVLIAPTWRGPLPTAMGEDRRPLYGRIRRLIEMPVLGQALYRVNVSGPVVARMMRAHVYAEPAHVDAGLLAAKLAVTRRERARFATAAFVTGELDPVRSREAWLALFADGLPPTLVLRPASAPPRSTAEIDVLIASGRVHAAEVRGALAAHEEYPDDAAAAILGFVGAAD